jgi:hypothetical protein
MLTIFCSVPKLIVGVINGVEQLREVGRLLNGPQSVERRPEQTHVVACEEPYSDYAFAGHCR